MKPRRSLELHPNEQEAEPFFRGVFLAGAVWNLIGGLLLALFAPSIHRWSSLPMPVPSVHFYAWVALFMTFGIGYAMVWRAPEKHRGVLILGIIGKLALSAVFLTSLAASSGQIPRFFLIPINGDLVFAGLFWAYLQSSSNPNNSPREPGSDLASKD
ncbi:MAG: hypothetical protein NZV14_09205 [Bryobacteraceae bacterium]|nr:hypothetical protein [Bryobacteraceae bacterium]MDW8378328.1 hypothetical protein [Bryobacterales bacterium]